MLYSKYSRKWRLGAFCHGLARKEVSSPGNDDLSFSGWHFNGGAGVILGTWFSAARSHTRVQPSLSAETWMEFAVCWDSAVLKGLEHYLMICLD